MVKNSFETLKDLYWARCNKGLNLISYNESNEMNYMHVHVQIYNIFHFLSCGSHTFDNALLILSRTHTDRSGGFNTI